jgi:hypothetical protein
MPSDLAWDVPWIGISTDIVSRVGFGLTLLIPLHPATRTVSLFRGHEISLGWRD